MALLNICIGQMESKKLFSYWFLSQIQSGKKPSLASRVVKTFTLLSLGSISSNVGIWYLGL